MDYFSSLPPSPSPSFRTWTPRATPYLVSPGSTPDVVTCTVNTTGKLLLRRATREEHVPHAELPVPTASWTWG